MHTLDIGTEYYQSDKLWATLVKDDGYDVIVHLADKNEDRVFYKSELLSWVHENIIQVKSPKY